MFGRVHIHKYSTEDTVSYIWARSTYKTRTKFWMNSPSSIIKLNCSERTGCWLNRSCRNCMCRSVRRKISLRSTLSDSFKESTRSIEIKRKEFKAAMMKIYRRYNSFKVSGTTFARTSNVAPRKNSSARANNSSSTSEISATGTSNTIRSKTASIPCISYLTKSRTRP